MHKSLVFSCALISLLLSSCSNPIREDIADFIRDFSLDRAMLNVNKAYLECNFEVTDEESKEITDYQRIKFYFDKTSEDNYYLHQESYYFGDNYVVEDITSLNETIIKSENDSYLDNKITNLATTNETISKQAVEERLNKFFYRSNTGEIYSGGMYYGDDIGLITRYQDYMSVSEDKKSLTVHFDTFLNEGTLIEEITYSVNTLGMLTSWKQSYTDKITTFNGTINIKYNDEAIDF